jgi:hypothetical protein
VKVVMEVMEVMEIMKVGSVAVLLDVIMILSFVENVHIHLHGIQEAVFIALKQNVKKVVVSINVCVRIMWNRVRHQLL